MAFSNYWHRFGWSNHGQWGMICCRLKHYDTKVLHLARNFTGQPTMSYTDIIVTWWPYNIINPSKGSLFLHSVTNTLSTATLFFSLLLVSQLISIHLSNGITKPVMPSSSKVPVPYSYVYHWYAATWVGASLSGWLIKCLLPRELFSSFAIWSIILLFLLGMAIKCIHV